MMSRRKSETLHADKLRAVIEARAMGGVASGGQGGAGDEDLEQSQVLYQGEN